MLMLYVCTSLKLDIITDKSSDISMSFESYKETCFKKSIQVKKLFIEFGQIVCSKRWKGQVSFKGHIITAWVSNS